MASAPIFQTHDSPVQPPAGKSLVHGREVLSGNPAIAVSILSRLLLHMIDQARQAIEEMRLEQAKADIQTIGNRLNLLARLRFLEGLLTPRVGDPGVAAILVNIANARNQISLGADPTAVATQIETAVQNLATMQRYRYWSSHPPFGADRTELRTSRRPRGSGC